MNQKNFLYVVVALLLGFEVHAQQQSKTFPRPRPVYNRAENQPHIGLMGGVVNTNNSSGNTGEYGVDLGFQPYIPFGFGAEATWSDSPDRTGGNSARTAVLAKGTYNFGGSTMIIRNSYAGLALGSVIRDDNSFFAGGPLVGFDVPIADEGMWTLGANAKYLFVDGVEPDALAVNAAVKYWF